MIVAPEKSQSQSKVMTYTLTAEEWRKKRKGWEFPLYKIPGLQITEVTRVGGKDLSPRSDYQEQREAEFIKWLEALPQPDELIVSFTIPEKLPTIEERDNWKKLAIILPFFTAILGFLTPSFTEVTKSQLGNKKAPEVSMQEPKSKPTPSAPTPIATAATSAKASNLTQEEAVNLVNGWLKAKREIFAPPFDRTQLKQFIHTDGPLYEEISSPGKGIDYLEKNGKYWKYEGKGVRREIVFVGSTEDPILRVEIDQESTEYDSSGRNLGVAGKSRYKREFVFKKENGIWKIYDDQE